MASAIAHRLVRANLSRILMLELATPIAVRRTVCFSEAVYDGSQCVEGVRATLVDKPTRIPRLWQQGEIAVLVDPVWKTLSDLEVDVVIDAILAKKNLGTCSREAPLVIALGPGFEAGCDADVVIETNRGHRLGAIVVSGPGESNTGIPCPVEGYSLQRVIRAPCSGRFETTGFIGDRIEADSPIGTVAGIEVRAPIGGTVRGLIRPGIEVERGTKLCDLDPRDDSSYCHTISDKARAIAGSVLETILGVYNIPGQEALRH
jgi:xanthine dehydrogenase accessory factor